MPELVNAGKTGSDILGLKSGLDLLFFSYFNFLTFLPLSDSRYLTPGKLFYFNLSFVNGISPGSLICVFFPISDLLII